MSSNADATALGYAIWARGTIGVAIENDLSKNGNLLILIFLAQLCQCIHSIHDELASDLELLFQRHSTQVLSRERSSI
jgi:hypothetical protein